MKPRAEELISAAYRLIGIPYDTMDCQAFVEECLREIGAYKNLPGSNSWYRAMNWTGTPEECQRKYGKIPVGAFLFILKTDGGEPEKFKGDGIGNADHIGIYTGSKGKGAVHSSKSKGQVCESSFSGKSINGGWNRVGLWTEGLDYEIPKNEVVKTVEIKMKVWADAGETVNLRTAKSTNANLVDRVPIGETVTAESEGDGWSWVRWGSKAGYMQTRFLAQIGDAVIDKEKTAQLIEIYHLLGKVLGLEV